MRYRTFLESASSGTDSYLALQISRSYISLKITDCDSRPITLYFEPDSGQRSLRQARGKVDKLRKALDLIDNALDAVERVSQ